MSQNTRIHRSASPRISWAEGDSRDRFVAGAGFTAKRVRGPELSATERQMLVELLNARSIPGQPQVTMPMLEQALQGVSAIDSGFWKEIKQLRHVLVYDDAKRLVGAGAYGIRENGSTTLPWFSASEERQTTAATLDLLLMLLGSEAEIDAFGFATALGFGLEGLPVSWRPATDAILRKRGFGAEDLWLYMSGPARHHEPTPDIEVQTGTDPEPRSSGSGEARSGGGGTRTLELEARGPRGGHVGEATAELGPEGIGVVWWLEVEKRARRRGYGRKLLRRAISELADVGAERVLLYVDHDDSRLRSRSEAIALYESEGFEVIDHLHSYRRVGSGTSRAESRKARQR